MDFLIPVVNLGELFDRVGKHGVIRDRIDIKATKFEILHPAELGLVVIGWMINHHFPYLFQRFGQVPKFSFFLFIQITRPPLPPSRVRGRLCPPPQVGGEK